MSLSTRGIERISDDLIRRYRTTRDHGLPSISEREAQARLRPRTGLIAVAGAVGLTADHTQRTSAAATASPMTRTPGGSHERAV